MYGIVETRVAPDSALEIPSSPVHFSEQFYLKPPIAHLNCLSWTGSAAELSNPKETYLSDEVD
jgi:hypothetical protein